MKKELFEIAARNIYAVEQRGDLDQRYRDDDDFLDVAVWTLRKMLEEAYELGKQDGDK